MVPINYRQNKTSTKCAAVSMVLTGSLTGEDIESARRKLTEVISASDQIFIDSQGLEELDEHGQKFLCAAHRHVIQQGFIAGRGQGDMPELILLPKIQMLRKKDFWKFIASYLGIEGGLSLWSGKILNCL